LKASRASAFLAVVNFNSQCAVILPCFNEAEHIGPLIVEIKHRIPMVIVVDDGSSDGTAANAERAGALVIRHSSNAGKGAALTTGLRHAFEKGFAWAMTMDGDGQHSPENIPAFLQAAESDAALIVGNRMGNPGDMPTLRRFVNRWMSRRLSVRAGQSLPDSQCGFRMLRLEAWSRLPLRTSHFEIESEMLLAFAETKCSIQFVPIRVIYKSEQSKIHPVSDTWRWFRWWLGSKRTSHFCEVKPIADEMRSNLKSGMTSKSSLPTR